MSAEICNFYAKKKDDMWLPVHIHALDTAEMSQKMFYSMCDESKLPEDFPKVLKLVAYLHDVGKLTKSFQSKITRGKNNKSSHAAAGEAILIRFGFNRRIASIVGAHHGIPQRLRFTPEDYYITALNENPKVLTDEQRKFIYNALEYAGFNTLSDVPNIDVGEMHLIWGLVAMADWLVSNEAYFPLFPLDQNDLTPEQHRNRVAEALLRIDMPSGWKPCLPRMSQNEFIKRFGFRPNNSQRMCYKIANDMKTPGIMIIEEKMGGGKTEGALGCAEVLATKFNCSGLAFFLPTKSTTDCMFNRVTNWLQNQSDKSLHSISLSHSSAYLNDDYSMITDAFNENTCLVSPEFFKRGKTDLLANFTVATIDKGIISAYKTKHYGMKLLGLHNKVAIIDECHAYDARMNTYLDNLLEYLGYFHTPVIILSATLPAERRRELVAAYNTGTKVTNNRKSNYVDKKSKPLFPRITWVDNGRLNVRTLSDSAKKKDVVIDVKRINSCNVERTLRSELRDGGCAGIIVNTVREAQQLCAHLRESLNGFHVSCIHSMFTDGDRKRMEDRVYARVGKESGRKKRDKTVVVGTQVLEQSLDIDFDVLFTQMCPADLLFQRIGRLHRHDRYRPKSLRTPRLYIIKDNESAYKIYESFLVNRTDKRIGKTLSIPSQIPRIVNGVYDLTKSERMALEVYNDTHQSPSKFFTNEQCAEYLSYKKNVEETKRQAAAFKVRSPHEYYDDSCTLNGVLDNLPQGESKDKVRDGLNSISAYIVKDGGRHLVRWAKPDYDRKTYYGGHKPTGEYITAVLQQRISLPSYFAECKNETLNELSTMLYPEYKKIFNYNAILRRGNFLALDKDNKVTLCGKHLYYDKELGLCMS